MNAALIPRCAGFVAAAGLLLTLHSPHSVAATNDVAFNDCMQILRQRQFKLTNDPWLTSRLPNDIEKIERENLYGDSIVRWTAHKNQNGSTTYVVLARGIEPDEPFDDPDGFHVILKQGNTVSFKYDVAASAFAFSATQRHGVNGLIFCTDGGGGPLWNWTGNDWHP